LSLIPGGSDRPFGITRTQLEELANLLTDAFGMSAVLLYVGALLIIGGALHDWNTVFTGDDQ
jgi:hypothetical protein